MGSFNATCIVSNLAIEAGDQVRYLVLARSAFHPDGNDWICYVGGRWQLHGIPVKAVYNDYGSVEGIEESFTTEVFFKGISTRAVEKGTGDNMCHDVAVRDDMDREDWLNALREGRVEVRDLQFRPRPKIEGLPKEVSDRLDRDDPKIEEAPVGLPTLRRVESVLAEAGLQLSKAYCDGGYLLDEVSPGFIRIRVGDFHPERGRFEQILPLLHAAGYAAMTTAGTGNYSHSKAEVLVAPLPPTDPNVHLFTTGLAPEDRYSPMDPRPLSQAMIREDVWQILIGMPIDSWTGNTYTVEHLKEHALKALEEDIVFRESLKTMSVETKAYELLMRHMGDGDRGNLFRETLSGPEGTSGFYFRSAYDLATEMAKDPEELKAYVLDMAETIYAQWVYSTLYGQWHPTTNSSQDGQWELHREFHTKLAQIKGRWEKEEEEDDLGMGEGSQVLCVDAVEDLVQGETYAVVEMVDGRVRVQHPTIPTSSCLTHHQDRFQVVGWEELPEPPPAPEKPVETAPLRALNPPREDDWYPPWTDQETGYWMFSLTPALNRLNPDTGRVYTVAEIVKHLGLRSASTDETRAACEKVVAANPEKVAQYRAGKTQLIGFFIKLVMDETNKQASPKDASAILIDLLVPVST